MPMRRPDFSRRVAVTGLGIISPIGQDVDTVWDNLVHSRSGLKKITRWDPTPYEAQVSGEINDFDGTSCTRVYDAAEADALIDTAVLFDGAQVTPAVDRSGRITITRTLTGSHSTLPCARSTPPGD